jgi:hypothetical protein
MRRRGAHIYALRNYTCCIEEKEKEEQEDISYAPGLREATARIVVAKHGLSNGVTAFLPWVPSNDDGVNRAVGLDGAHVTCTSTDVNDRHWPFGGSSNRRDEVTLVARQVNVVPTWYPCVQLKQLNGKNHVCDESELDENDKYVECHHQRGGMTIRQTEHSQQRWRGVKR